MGSRSRTRTADLGYVALGVVALAALALGGAGPVRALLIASASLLVPGRLLTRPHLIGDPWARSVLTPVSGAAVCTVVALAMVWSRIWHPSAAFAILLSVSLALLTSMVIRRRSPWTRPSAVAGRSSVALVRRWAAVETRVWWGRLYWLGLLNAVELCLLGLRRTDTTDMGDWGLLTRFPPAWYLGLFALLALCCLCLANTALSEARLGAAVVALTIVLYGSAAAVEPGPRLPWIYKHIAVTRYIETFGSVNPSIDIYHRWPGFFSLTAYLGTITGYQNPVRYAGWAELLFALLNAMLVLAIARTLTRRFRCYWTAVLVFGLTNWVGQNYYSPQALAFVFYLSLALLVLTYLRASPGRSALRLESLVGRVARRPPARDVGPTFRGVSGPRAAAVAAVLGLQCVIVATHQLTPYLALLAFGPLFVLGYLRPRWVAGGLAALTLLYLAPNYAYIQAHFGLFSGFDPVANATYSPVDRSRVPPASVWQGRGTQLLSLGTWLLAASGLLGAARRGRTRQALLIGWLALSPGLSLLAQSYGGEGRLRVFLFSLPWSAIAAAWLLSPKERRSAPARRWGRLLSRSVLVPGLLTGLLALFVVTYFQPEADVQIPPGEVSAAQWLDGQARRGDVAITTSITFPTLIGPHYSYFIGVPAVLTDYKKVHPGRLTDLVVRRYAASLSPGVHRTFLVFSSTDARFADSRRYFAPGEGAGLEGEVRADPRFRRVFSNTTAQIYQLG